MLYRRPVGAFVFVFLISTLAGCSTTYYDNIDPNIYDEPIGNRGRDFYVVSGAGGMGDGYLFHRDYFPTHYPYYRGYNQPLFIGYPGGPYYHR